MSTAVFDTNILIDYANQHDPARRIVEKYKIRLISVVTWIEFLTGIPAMQMDTAKEFLNDVFEIVYPDEDIYALTLAIRRQKRLKLPDSMIYATARAQGVPIVTRNTKDFDTAAPDVIVPY